MVHGKSSGFTPAAERTMLWCRQLLTEAADPNDRAALLVLALLHDESLASACLRDLGITEDRLRSGALGSTLANLLRTGLPKRLESEGSGCGPQRSLAVAEDPDDIQQILRRARELAIRNDTDQLITSSLLLIAITDQNACVRQQLTELGASPETLRSRLLPQQPPLTERLAVTESLEWSNGPTASTVTPAQSPATTRDDFSGSGAFEMAPPEPAVLRTIDACLNRAREGLRVLEDCARFVWNAPALSTELKSLRHELVTAEQRLPLHSHPQHSLLNSRDTPGDVGTTVTDPRERSRSSLRQLVLANARRVQESLRSLEEFGKLLDPDFAAVMKQLRYRSYALEQAFSALDQSPAGSGDIRERRLQQLQQAVIYVLITESQCRLPWLQAAEQALLGGADVLQLREKQLTDRELLQRARQLAHLCHRYSALFIMNDRPDIALVAGADGVHVGQEELSAADIRQLPDWQGLIGVSTHSVEQLRHAFSHGADYVGVGPVFPSSTKAFNDFPGLSFVRQAAAVASGPWFAIGGILPERHPDLLAAGARRIALTAAITQSLDPANAVRGFREAMDL